MPWTEFRARSDPQARFTVKSSAILKVKSGGRPDGYRNAEEGIDAVGDMVSWGGHVCLLYETREEAHLPGRRGH